MIEYQHIAAKGAEAVAEFIAQSHTLVALCLGISPRSALSIDNSEFAPKGMKAIANSMLTKNRTLVELRMSIITSWHQVW